MIVLRNLQEKDAVLMLEWMHDADIQKGFQKDMMRMTLEDAETFCRKSANRLKLVDGDSVHFAIVDDKDDEYLGTVSLKNLDLHSMTAEYAISTRKKVHGKGVGFLATGELLKKAFLEYGLHRIYLSVFADNIAAIRLYEKCGFQPEGEFREHIKRGDKYINWKWYGLLREEYIESGEGS